MYWKENQDIDQHQSSASHYLQVHRPVLRGWQIHHEPGDIVCMVEIVRWVFEEPQGSHHKQSVV